MPKFFPKRKCPKCKKQIGVNVFDRHEANCEPLEKRECPVCGDAFECKPAARKRTCSYSCSNRFFRTAEAKMNEKSGYKRVCFLYHEKKCVVCGEDNIVAVHHFDENHKNNKPKNLIPLCPTHHLYVHSKFKRLVIGKIKAYRKKFTGKPLHEIALRK